MRCQPREIETRANALQGKPRDTAAQLLQRLEDLQSAVGPRCRQCGYDLTMNQSGRCPECGAPIPADVLQTLKEAGPRNAARSAKRPNKALAAFAEVLSLSHQLSRELQRDRRSAR